MAIKLKEHIQLRVDHTMVAVNQLPLLPPKIVADWVTMVTWWVSDRETEVSQIRYIILGRLFIARMYTVYCRYY